MINVIQLIRNIGQFDSVTAGANIPLARLALVYSENGRGKTTLAAILRSLATGDPIPIAERRRLAAQHPPHVVLVCTGGPLDAMFQNNAWNRQLRNMAVFDDQFVDQNVYSGLAVEPGHRQNLHDLILGDQGVLLNRNLQQLVARIETHNTALRAMAAAIPAAERGPFEVDDFCALPVRADIDAAIQAAERNLAASQEQDPIRNTPPLDILSLPGFDVVAIDQLLRQDLGALDAAAAARVQAHLATLGPGGETWVAEGMRHIPQAPAGEPICPFCAQGLGGSPVIQHYRAYFSDAYAALKLAVTESLATLNRMHGGDILATFERAVRVVGQRRQFWSRFCEVPEAEIETVAVALDWQTARQAVAAALTAKLAAPLERMTLTQEARAAIAAIEAHRQAVIAIDQQLQQANAAIRLVKEQAAAGNTAALAADLARLKTTKARHEPRIVALCTNYLTEKAAKVLTEQQREQARTALDQHRAAAFPACQAAVNDYLQRFNAGFRLDSVVSANIRAGSACNYNVIINQTAVRIAGGIPVPGNPSFQNTLSAGDRNTLALAFFFATLDQDPALADKIVVIDDPISSLDEHRSLTTVQEIRRLCQRVTQVIVLSHSKAFLCGIWEGANPNARAALQISRDAVGSTIEAWDVNNDCITEHDRRHSLLRQYIANRVPNNREVAQAIRPTLEVFVRVAYPDYFSPGARLGSFRDLCEQRVGTAQQILDAADTQELRNLVEYANRFHHDTNAAWQTEVINDGELLGFVRRTLIFARR